MFEESQVVIPSDVTKYDKYLKMAQELGAPGARIIPVREVVLDPRTLLKCIFGCKKYDKNWACPNLQRTLPPWQFEEMLRRYSYGLLIHSHKMTELHRVAMALEKEAYMDGYYWAFALSQCVLCPDCTYPNQCKFPERLRPPMEALGIDVYATVRKYGFPIHPLRDLEKETKNFYGLLLIE